MMGVFFFSFFLFFASSILRFRNVECGFSFHVGSFFIDLHASMVQTGQTNRSDSDGCKKVLWTF